MGNNNTYALSESRKTWYGYVLLYGRPRESRHQTKTLHVGTFLLILVSIGVLRNYFLAILPSVKKGWARGDHDAQNRSVWREDSAVPLRRYERPVFLGPQEDIASRSPNYVHIAECEKITRSPGFTVWTRVGILVFRLGHNLKISC